MPGVLRKPGAEYVYSVDDSSHYAKPEGLTDHASTAAVRMITPIAP